MDQVELEGYLGKQRLTEMDRYGRSKAYDRLSQILPEQKRRIFELVNHGLALVDDMLDTSTRPLARLDSIVSIFSRSYSGEEVDVSTTEEQTIRDIGYALHDLGPTPFIHFRNRLVGERVGDEVIKYWNAEKEYFQRQWKILGRMELDKQAREIGGSVASQFLLILDSGMDWFERQQLARGYGQAVKLADNLCDFEEDARRGFVNVPLEDMRHVQGIEIDGNQVVSIDPDRLSLSPEYVQGEFARIQQLFELTDSIFYRTWLKCFLFGKSKKILPQFRNIAYSWFAQAKEFSGQNPFPPLSQTG